jgi:hypothetical protein
MNQLITRVTMAAWLVIGASMLIAIGLAMLVCPDYSVRRLPVAP